VVNQGIGDLDVDIGESNTTTINGNVRIICGVDGSLLMEDVIVNAAGTQTGYVSFNAPNAVSAVVVNIFAPTIANNTIAGFLSIVTGAGAENIDIEETTIGQNFALVTNAGADDVRLRTISVAGSSFADFGIGADLFELDDDDNGLPTIFTGVANFQMGDDTDTLNYSRNGDNAEDDFASFLAGGVANGGPPNNDASNGKVASNAGSPVDVIQVNFENGNSPAA
jgi:hypothetical protein